MKVLVVAITWMLCSITLVTPSPKLGVDYTTLTWELDYDTETYTAFINSVRSAYNKFGKVCNIPVTPKSAKGNDEFILVDIINTSGKTITAAFQTTNLYFLGFMDKFKNKDGKTYTRANFVSTEFERLKKSDLFKTADIKKKLPFGESYTDLERVAGSRANIPLGIVALSSNIDTIYGKDYKGIKLKAEDIGKTLAKFALMVIQMIAEATRFKYIEETVESKGILIVGSSDGTFKPDATFLLLETNWDSISGLIHKSSPGCNPVKSPAFPQWSDIKTQVGLLKYVGNGLDEEGIFGNNVVDVALEFIM